MSKNRVVGNVETFEYNIGVGLNDVSWFGFVKAGSAGAHTIRSINKKENSSSIVEISIETLKTSLERDPLQISMIAVANSSNGSELKFKKPWSRTPKKTQ
jgi:hypothetical protein